MDLIRFTLGVLWRVGFESVFLRMTSPYLEEGRIPARYFTTGRIEGAWAVRFLSLSQAQHVPW